MLPEIVKGRQSQTSKYISFKMQISLKIKKTNKFGAYSRHDEPGRNFGETKYGEKGVDVHQK